MIKKTAFLLGLLATYAAQADVQVKANLEFVSDDGVTQQMDYDQVLVLKDLSINGDLVGTIGGYSVTSKLVEVTDEQVTIVFDILNAAGEVIARRVLFCAWDTETVVEIGSEIKSESVEALKLTVVVSRV